MYREPIIKLEKPTDSVQVLHLIDMDHYFGNDLHIKPLDEAVMLNYAYGVANTKNFTEFCDTMHTALYWMNDKYSHLCQIDKASEAINLATEIDKGGEVDDEALRYDILFGAWLSFVSRDTAKLRGEFLNELSGFSEDDFIQELHNVSDQQVLVETFCLEWIKKMIDPNRAAGYGHYMMYMMVKVMTIMRERGENLDIMNRVLTALYILTQSVSKLCSMNEHQLPMN